MSGPSSPLPAGPLVAFYGDDLTGATASMEAFAWQGLKTVLFLKLPSPERLAEFADYRSIGLAGIARSKGPGWMDAHLPAIFERLAISGAPIIHYKVCSTFDSAPHIGSIGKAADIGADLFPGPVAMLAGDLGMGRVQVFGNLFAQAKGEYFRLDRHPTMANHPSTPMQEADLARHLSHQTALPVTNVSFLDLKGGNAAESIHRAHAAGSRIFSIDLIDEETLRAAGRLIWMVGGAQKFVIGSQGVQAALAACWRADGLLTEPQVETPVRPIDRIAVASGSVSPVTAEQIAYALSHGFEGIRLDLSRALDPELWRAELDRAAMQCRTALSDGRDPLVYTARGPDDPAVQEMQVRYRGAPEAVEAVNDRIGGGLGRILDRLLAETGLKRVILSGGDTSSHAASHLRIDALTCAAKLAPGGPLCRAHSQDPSRNGIEIALKGGQVGAADYFVKARDG